MAKQTKVSGTRINKSGLEEHYEKQTKKGRQFSSDEAALKSQAMAGKTTRTLAITSEAGRTVRGALNASYPALSTTSDLVNSGLKDAQVGRKEDDESESTYIQREDEEKRTGVN